MKVRWNGLKDDFLPNPFQTGSRRAKNPYQIGVLVVSEGGLERPQSAPSSSNERFIDRSRSVQPEVCSLQSQLSCSS
jgi:hypothetical protein